MSDVLEEVYSINKRSNAHGGYWYLRSISTACWALFFCAFCAFLWPAFLCGFSWREPEGREWWEIDRAIFNGDGVVAAVGFGVGAEDEIVVAFV